MFCQTNSRGQHFSVMKSSAQAHGPSADSAAAAAFGLGSSLTPSQQEGPRLSQIQFSLFTFFPLCNISCAFLPFKSAHIFIPDRHYIFMGNHLKDDHLAGVVCGNRDGFLCESQNQHYWRRCRPPAGGCCSRRGTGCDKAVTH